MIKFRNIFYFLNRNPSYASIFTLSLKNEPKNYKTIIILNIVSRIFEKIITFISYKKYYLYCVIKIR